MAMPAINVGSVYQATRSSKHEDVKIVVFTDGSSSLSKEMVSFAKGIATGISYVKVEYQDANGGRNERMKAMHIEHWPCMVLMKGDFSRIRYYGIPSGYEQSPFMDAILELSTASAKLSPASKTLLTNVRRRANIKVFVLTTCTYCPIVARHAFRAAIESPMVTTEVIDSSVFVELSQKHLVQGVPKVILNDITDMTGAVNESAFIEKLREADHSLIDSMFG